MQANYQPIKIRTLLQFAGNLRTKEENRDRNMHG